MAKGWTKRDDPYDRTGFATMLEEFREEVRWSYADLSRAVGRSIKAKGSLNKAKRLASLSRELRREIVRVMVNEKEARGQGVDLNKLMSVAGLAESSVAKMNRSSGQASQSFITKGTRKMGPEDNNGSEESSYRAKTLEELLRELDELQSQFYSKGIWTPRIIKNAEEALKLVKPGTKEWAKIKVHYLPLMYQQAGDVEKAKKCIEDVERKYIGVVENPDWDIVGEVEHIKGWMELEQRGNFKAAIDLFSRSLELTNDPVILSDNHHLRLRAITDDAKTESDAWLTLMPVGGAAASQAHLTILAKSLAEDLPASRRNYPDNPHHYKVEIDARALTRPYEAREMYEKEDVLQSFRQTGNEHVRALTLARALISNGSWEEAIARAEEAQEGYRRIMYPVGIAHSSEVAAYALMRRGKLDSQGFSKILDLWILAALLHPHPTHPLYKIARDQLRKSIMEVAKEPMRALAYFSEVIHRVQEREGVFKALDAVFIKDFYSNMLLFSGWIEGLLGELPEKPFLLEALNLNKVTSRRRG